MGDRKPQKNSSGNAEKHKAKQAKQSASQDMTRINDANKKSGDKK